MLGRISLGGSLDNRSGDGRGHSLHIGPRNCRRNIAYCCHGYGLGGRREDAGGLIHCGGDVDTRWR